jgi:hypothetical protein
MAEAADPNAKQLWGKAKQVVTSAALSTAFHTLRDVAGDTYIEGSELQVVKRLGEGAFATVDQAW